MLEHKTVEQVLTGDISMRTFILLLKTNTDLQKYINQLVPSGAIYNKQHIFWKRISYEAFQNNNFDFMSFLYKNCRFDGSIGDNLNVFAFLKNVYTYSYSDIQCTAQYQDAFELYLDVVKDRYDGPEVRDVVERIMQDALLGKSKTERMRLAQKAITNQFHLVKRVYPRWIQGAEWPMGMNSPMSFVDQQRQKGCVEYRFVDVDTGHTRIVKQFF